MGNGAGAVCRLVRAAEGRVVLGWALETRGGISISSVRRWCPPQGKEEFVLLNCFLFLNWNRGLPSEVPETLFIGYVWFTDTEHS